MSLITRLALYREKKSCIVIDEFALYDYSDRLGDTYKYRRLDKPWNTSLGNDERELSYKRLRKKTHWQQTRWILNKNVFTCLSSRILALYREKLIHRLTNSHCMTTWIIQSILTMTEDWINLGIHRWVTTKENYHVNACVRKHINNKRGDYLTKSFLHVSDHKTSTF